MEKSVAEMEPQVAQLAAAAEGVTDAVDDLCGTSCEDIIDGSGYTVRQSATVAASLRRRPSMRCTYRAALCAGVRHHVARRLRGRGTAGRFHTREHGGRSLPEELHLLSIREPQTLRPEWGAS